MTPSSGKSISTDSFTAAAAPQEHLLRIPLPQLFASGLNPRTHFPPASLRELAASLAGGQLMPLLVRPHPKRKGAYEIAAGHRRHRAALETKLDALLCRVVDLDDAAFLEALTVEQIQHEDFTPLEEAQTYENLRKVGKLSVAEIAEKVKKEQRYITDRLRLLTLSKEARAFLESGEIRLEHAIILARLSPTDQAAAIAEGLWEREGFFGHDGGGRKPHSPRELQGWIDHRVRFTVDAVAADLFPDTVGAIVSAEKAKLPVVSITYEHVLPPSAKSDTERTFGPQLWRPVGQKPCDHVELGVVRAGQNRGQSFPVCRAKKTCRLHWGDEIKSRERVEKAAATGDAAKVKAAAEKRRADEEAREVQRARWATAAPAIGMAVVKKIKKANVGPTGLGKLLLEHVRPDGLTARALKVLAQPRTVEDLVRYLVALELLANVHNSYTAERSLTDACKRLGIDAKAILDNVAPLDRPKAPAKNPATKVPMKKAEGKK
jgi:ParB/RepB/Spo0J family partition protein